MASCYDGRKFDEFVSLSAPVNTLVSIDEVNLRRAWLVLGWVTVSRRVSHLRMYQPPRSTQHGHPSVGRCSEHQRTLGSQQAHRAMHWLRISGLAVYAGVWLRAKETEINAAVWALRLLKDFAFTFFTS